TPHDIYDRPATTFVAQLVGTPRINLLAAGHEDGSLFVPNSPIRLPVPGTHDSLGAATLPSSFVLGVRPEDLLPQSNGAFVGEVMLVEPLGVETIVHIKAGEHTLLSMVPGMTTLRIGDQVHFNIARDRLHYFRVDGTRVT
ncbi:MAG TPA: TOBE domain-containing protein, partial [Ardenticatenaceae bacterium]|nr:TOBE domain-containing protein [Ardenticatenaceae bacterium]